MRISDWSSDVCSSDLPSRDPSTFYDPGASPGRLSARLTIARLILSYTVSHCRREPSDKEKAGKCRPIFVRNFLLLLGRHRQKVEIMWVDCGHRTGLHRADERFWQEVDKIDIFDREDRKSVV